jgi:hypothetical protein
MTSANVILRLWADTVIDRVFSPEASLDNYLRASVATWLIHEQIDGVPRGKFVPPTPFTNTMAKAGEALLS